MKFLTFFLLLLVILAHLDPDLDSEYESGSTGPIESGSGSAYLVYIGLIILAAYFCHPPNHKWGIIVHL
jgi:hypothetical protein